MDQTVLITAISIGTVPYLFPSSSFNSTSSHLNRTVTEADRSLNLNLAKFCNLTLMLYLTPTFSWGRTFIYLRGHIKQMTQSTSHAFKRNSPTAKTDDMSDNHGHGADCSVPSQLPVDHIHSFYILNTALSSYRWQQTHYTVYNLNFCPSEHSLFSASQWVPN